MFGSSTEGTTEGPIVGRGGDSDGVTAGKVDTITGTVADGVGVVTAGELEAIAVTDGVGLAEGVEPPPRH